MELKVGDVIRRRIADPTPDDSARQLVLVFEVTAIQPSGEFAADLVDTEVA